jgi:alpha-1,2-mannosyltransferase
VKTAVSRIAGLWVRQRWLWYVCYGAAAFIHAATALLRLDSFFPFPQAVDFSSYYAAAWHVRLGISPYPWSADLLRELAAAHGLMTAPPIHNSPPLWAWMLQPITLLSYPAAATLWLFILLGLSGYCHVLLARQAGYEGWRKIVLTLPVTLTFGPLFLNLTLGQNGVWLLAGALLLGGALRQNPARAGVPALVSWVIAVGAKIYPVLWSLALLKRWRYFAAAVVLCAAVFGLQALLEPEINRAYWLDFIPSQARAFAVQVSVDDQSLPGFLSRVGRSGEYSFPGLDAGDMRTVYWALPWDIPADFIRYISCLLAGIFGLGLAAASARNKNANPDGVLYALVLFSLLPFPHTARYNHILALPAMAWLWKQGGLYRHLAALAYGLFALSRLNHLWALLPSPLAPFASGFGLFGVLTLLIGAGDAAAGRRAESRGRLTAPSAALPQRRQPRQFNPLQHLQRRAAPGGNVRHPVCQAGLVDRRHRVAAADDGHGAAVCHGLRHAKCAAGKVG